MSEFVPAIIDRSQVTAALPGYEVGEQLGAGAFGLILAARHRDLDRPVAVKVFAGHPAGSAAGFKAEARLLAMLNHPHIVGIYDYVERGELCLIIMELLPGGTLTRRCALSPEGACAVGLAAADALAYAHARGVLHRDVKPDNMIFSDNGLLKLTDFGIAKIFAGAAATVSRAVGTPKYMAPEQFQSRRLGPATDLYALALVLYELLAGRPPFDPDASEAALMRHHLDVVPPPPPGVPAPVAEVVMRSLAKAPTARHPSARAFAMDLATAAARTYGRDWLARCGITLRVADEVRDAAGRPTLAGPTLAGPTPGDGAGDRREAPSNQPRRTAATTSTQSSSSTTSSSSSASAGSGDDRDGEHRGSTDQDTIVTIRTGDEWDPSRPGPLPRPPALVPVLAPGPAPGPGPAPVPAAPGVPVDAAHQLRTGVVDVDAVPAEYANTTVPLRDRLARSRPAVADIAARLRRRPALAVGILLTVLLAAVLTIAVLPASTQPLIMTVAGAERISGDGGPASLAPLENPTGVAVDGAGNLYVAERDGDRVRRVDATGTITTVAGTGDRGFGGDGGPAAHARFARPFAVAVDGAGNLYIADRSNNRVRRVDATGTVTTVAGPGTAGFAGDGGPAADAHLTEPFGVAFDGTGNLYIADWGNHRVRRVDTTGTITTVAGTGTAGFVGDGGPATDAQLSHPTSVAVDSSGNLYVADAGNSRIRRIDVDGTMTSIAGTGEYAFSGDGGPATQARLASPTSVAIAADGGVVIADKDNERVRRISTSGIITTIAGGAVRSFSGDGGPALEAELAEPTGVAFDGAGNLYIADRGNDRVRRIDTTGTITTVAGTPMTRLSGDGGSAAAAQLWKPFGVAVDSAGNVYVATWGDDRVRRVDTTGTITTVAGTGTAGFSGDGGPAAGAHLDYPFGVAVDSAGNLYIADGGNHRVRRVDTTGTITTVAGTGTASGTASGSGTGAAGFAGDGGPAADAHLATPCGVAVDTAGNLYIADRDNHRVRRVDTFGTITTVAGTGTAGFAGDDGPAADAHLATPSGVAVDTAGNLYIADRRNHRVRRVDTTGTITTVAGTGTAGFSGDDGSAADAHLTEPTGVAVDGAGNLYIADWGNHRVRRVDTTGTITTVAGTGTAGFSGDGGPAPHAQLSGPSGVVVDGTGNLYVADTGNRRVRRIDANGT